MFEANLLCNRQICRGALRGGQFRGGISDRIGAKEAKILAKFLEEI
jgi:hypothetical protein